MRASEKLTDRPQGESKKWQSATVSVFIVMSAVGIAIVKLTARSLGIEIAAIVTAIAFLLVQVFFLKKISKNKFNSVQTLIFRLLCCGWIAFSLSRIIIAPVAPPQSAEDVLVGLGKELFVLRIRYEALLESPDKALEVQKDASRLARDMLAVNDKDLELDMQIFKYQSLAYAEATVAGSEMIPGEKYSKSEKLKAVEELLKACMRAKELIEEAQRAPLDQKFKDTRDWVVKDAANERIQRLTAVAYCLRFKVSQEDDYRRKARQTIQELPAQYLEKEHPERSYELQPCMSDVNDRGIGFLPVPHRVSQLSHPQIFIAF